MGLRPRRVTGWRQIVESHYGHTRVRLIDEIHAYSTHYVYRLINGRKFVLSQVAEIGARPPFGVQFQLIETLHRAGVPTVSLPMRRESNILDQSESPFFVKDSTDYWFVRRFVKHWHADWSENVLVERAAETLAAIHQADVRPWMSTVQNGDFNADRLDPYYWSVLDVVNGLGELAARLRDDLMSQDEAIDVVHLAKELPDEARETNLGPVGLTHADYRPENILVSRRGRIVEVIDWDRARPDHQLFDAVLAGLQIANWNHRHGRNDLGVADRFVDAYRDARGLDIDDAAVRWMFRFTLVKALLLSRDPNRWRPLFRAYMEADRSFSVQLGPTAV